MKQYSLKRELNNLLAITAAAVLYAAGVSLFLDPNRLAPGGITGLAVILNRITSIETGTLYLLLNIPIVLLGLWKLGWRLIAKTAYAIVATSVFTNLLIGRGPLTEDLLLASLAGALLMAGGMGIIFMAGATTGGSDIIVKILRKKYRHLKTGFLFQCMDTVVVALSGLVFRDINIALYALLTVLVSGRALDAVLYGGDQAKMMLIITKRDQAVAERIMRELSAGVTYLHGQGAWTKEEKKVIVSVVHNRLGPRVEEIVKAEDPEAFMIITNASEIYGEGYKDFFADIV